ncbi:MAG: glycosyltransferase family 2 protein [Parabacteroides sp.]|nr:glycosyltransferase family 2 protein [Parabacteroides sp.]
MKEIHIITPVKDSIELTLQTIESILSSEFTTPYHYYVYNDFSTPENAARLQKASEEMVFELIHLTELTKHPSPNYLLILQMAQQKAIEAEAGLLIVESDVVVKNDTLQKLFDGVIARPDCGIAAAVTVDEKGDINYPYLYAKGKENMIFPEKKHVSFCCSLLTLPFLKKFGFHLLDPEKNWHDVTISHRSIELGFVNYLFTSLPVWHRPHSSRPWKQLKYSNPLKYYWLKFTKGLDKI